jgi:hypothetical protein
VARRRFLVVRASRVKRDVGDRGSVRRPHLPRTETVLEIHDLAIPFTNPRHVMDGVRSVNFEVAVRDALRHGVAALAGPIDDDARFGRDRSYCACGPTPARCGSTCFARPSTLLGTTLSERSESKGRSPRPQAPAHAVENPNLQRERRTSGRERQRRRRKYEPHAGILS